MAFTDPQSITIDGTAFSAARAYTGTPTGEFRSADSAVVLEIVPPKKGGARKHAIARLRHSKIAADPLSAQNARVSDLITLNINRPLDGYTDAEVIKQVVGFFAWLTAGTNANLTKLVAGEN